MIDDVRFAASKIMAACAYDSAWCCLRNGSMRGQRALVDVDDEVTEGEERDELGVRFDALGGGDERTRGDRVIGRRLGLSHDQTMLHHGAHATPRSSRWSADERAVDLSRPSAAGFSARSSGARDRSGPRRSTAAPRRSGRRGRASGRRWRRARDDPLRQTPADGRRGLERGAGVAQHARTARRDRRRSMIGPAVGAHHDHAGPAAAHGGVGQPGQRAPSAARQPAT